MTRRRLMGKRVVLTGASSGIGRALAFELAQRGAELLITARRAERLEVITRELTGLGAVARYVAGDITAESTRAAIAKFVADEWNGLDLLVNNAGVGALGPFALAGPERLRRVLDTNFLAPAELIRICLPALRLGSQPLIVNIGSVLGHRAMPNKSEYCASKFALQGFSSALRAELVQEGIGVLVVSPSTTETEFFDAVLESRPGIRQRSLGRMPSKRVAVLACNAMERGTSEVVLSWGGRGLVWLNRWFPRAMDWFAQRFG